MTARPHPNVFSFRHGILVYSHVKPEFLKYQVICVIYFLKLKTHIKPSLRYKGGSFPWSVNTGKKTLDNNVTDEKKLYI